ncbi:MAG TPA: glycosyltransferase [Vicinamibacterales bacterium]|nr:glycosyltransferase [Vicinamibacterales bacterium]
MLYVSPVGERGGAETVLLNLLRFQDRLHFNPIVCFLKAGPIVEEARLIVNDVFVYPTARLRNVSSLSAIRAIRRLICARRIDIVFGNMTMGHVYGGLAAVGTGARAVWFDHGVLRQPDAVDHIAARVPAAATFATSARASRARAAFSRKPPVQVVPAGIDVDTYDSTRYERGSIRRALGIDAIVPVVACVARLQRWKGHSLFLQAAALIHRDCPEAHFLIAGGALFGLEERYADELRREARTRLPDGHVHFLGHRDDVPAVLADVDVLVHCPVEPEPFGLVVVEAMAMGVPVVSVRGSGPEEIVGHEQTGILVAPGDAAALSGAASALLRDPERRQAMGRAGRCRACERYSARRMVKDIESELQRLVDR